MPALGEVQLLEAVLLNVRRSGSSQFWATSHFRHVGGGGDREGKFRVVTFEKADSLKFLILELNCYR